jgi:hypothetical protein
VRLVGQEAEAKDGRAGSGAIGKVEVEGWEFVLGWLFMVEPLRLELGRLRASDLAPRTGGPCLALRCLGVVGEAGEWVTRSGVVEIFRVCRQELMELL